MKIINYNKINEVNESYLMEVVEAEAKLFNAYISGLYDGDDDHSEFIVNDVQCLSEGILLILANEREIRIEMIDTFGASAVMEFEDGSEREILTAIVDSDEADFEVQFSKGLFENLKKYGDNTL